MSEIEQSTNTSECFFLTDKHTQAMGIIDIGEFSLLIDLEQAMFNLSAFIRFKTLNDNEDFLMEVQFTQVDYVINEDDSLRSKFVTDYFIFMRYFKYRRIIINHYNSHLDYVTLFIFEKKFLNSNVN
jgi:hypothetical protein